MKVKYLLVVILVSLMVVPGVEGQVTRKELHPETKFKMYIRNWCDGDPCFVLEGGIGEGASDKLKRMVKRNPGIKKIWLWSTGGWVNTGVWLHNYIKQYELTTYTKICESACTIAFMGGKERVLVKGANGLGFHRINYFFGGNPGLTADERRVMRMFRKQRVADDFVKQMFKDRTDNNLWYPSDARLVDDGVVTRIVEFDNTNTDWEK